VTNRVLPSAAPRVTSVPDGNDLVHTAGQVVLPQPEAFTATTEFPVRAKTRLPATTGVPCPGAVQSLRPVAAS
jgi:hypothetical protein